MNELSAVANFFKEGGIFLYLILAVGVLISAIAIERFVVIRRAAGLNGRKFTDDLVQAIRRGDLTTARQLSRVSNTPVAQVAQAVLQAGDGDHAAMQAASDDAATLALPALSRRLGQLSLLANVATLLGLLGTIAGLITAFAGVGAADPAQRSAFLAAGISTGLNATAFGLIIAVPALLVHGWLVGMVESVSEQVDEIGIRIANAILQARGSHAAASVTALHGQRLNSDGAAAMPARVAAGGARSVMPRRGRGGAQFREDSVDQLELRPLMNVFIVLIPMLLMSAVFVEIRVIEMSPSPVASASPAAAAHDYDLALVIHDDAYVLEGDGVVLQSIPRATRGDGPSRDAAASLTRVLTEVVASHPGLQDVRIVSGPAIHYQELVALMDLARATGLSQTALEASAIKGA